MYNFDEAQQKFGHIKAFQTYIVGVSYFNKNNILPDNATEYLFLIKLNNETFKQFVTKYPIGTILNSQGYDYRKNRVCLRRLSDPIKEKYLHCFKNLLTIRKIEQIEISVLKEEGINIQVEELNKKQNFTEKIMTFLKDYGSQARAEILLNEAFDCNLNIELNDKGKEEISISNSVVINSPDLLYNDCTIGNEWLSINQDQNTISCPQANRFGTNTMPIIDLEDQVKKIVRKIDEEKENKGKMFKNIFNGTNFGLTKDVKLSFYGPAFKNDQKWIAYQEDNLIDINNMIIEGDFCYIIPTAKVEVGDYILHHGEWTRVIEKDNNYTTVVKISSNEVVKIMPEKNIFGFNYYSKLFVPFGDNNGFNFINNVNEDNPFGSFPMVMMLMNQNNVNGASINTNTDTTNNFNNLMLMMLLKNLNVIKDNESNEKNRIENMLPFLLMNNSNNKDNNMLPFLLMMLEKDNSSKDQVKNSK